MGPLLAAGASTAAAVLLVLSALEAVGAAAAAAAAEVPPPTGGWTFALSYFTGNGEHGVRIATSADGLAWSAAQGGRPVLRPRVGAARLARDPSVAYDARAGVFHAVWTAGWDGSVLGYAMTRDLVRWTGQRPLDVGVPGTRNAWAPEAFVGTDGTVTVVWSSTVRQRGDPEPPRQSASENGYDHRLWYTTLRNASAAPREPAPPRLFFDPGFSVIDGAVVRIDEGRHLLVLKDERRWPPRKCLRLAVSRGGLHGPYGAPGPPLAGGGASGFWAEGPSPLMLPNGTLLVLFDKYARVLPDGAEGGDQAGGGDNTRVQWMSGEWGAVAADPPSYSKWRDLSDRVRVPKGARHGTAFAVPERVFTRLRNLPAFGGRGAGGNEGRPGVDLR